MATTKKITTVDSTSSVTNIFVNDSNSLKQISKANFISNLGLATSSQMSSANSSISKAQNDISSLQNSVKDIEERIISVDTEDDWEVIQRNVQMGYGKKFYPVGTIFSVACVSGAPYYAIQFVVIGHDHDKKPGDDSAHTMTLHMVHAIYGRQVDAVEAFYYAENGLAAGTYNVTINVQPWYADDVGKSFQFTLTKAVPAGGQLVWDGYNATRAGRNVSVFASSESRTAQEIAVMSQGTGGTALGNVDGSTSNMNHFHRTVLGSNNYEESAIRQWLNSGQKRGNWWKSTNKFDRPCTYADNTDGFLTYLDPQFVAVVGITNHLNRTNTVFDLNGTTKAYSTDDKFFLLSNEEVNFSTESSITTGTVYEYFKDATNELRIKYDISSTGTARLWWLRTPVPSNALGVRYVGTSGALNYRDAGDGTGAAAACVIY